MSTLSRAIERICASGIKPRAAADWSARLVMVRVVTTLPMIVFDGELLSLFYARRYYGTVDSEQLRIEN